MTAREAIRQTNTPLMTPARVWPQAGEIIDLDGTRISGVVVLGPPRYGQLLFDHIDNPDALLMHVFGRGGGPVTLHLDHERVMVMGWIETHWDGVRRAWWLDLEV